MYSQSDDRPLRCEMVEARFTDLLGRVKAMALPLSAPSDDPARIAEDPAVAAGITVDGSSVAGYASVENSDVHVAPDPKTVFLLPYHPGRAAVHCDLEVRGPGGEYAPFPLSPRGRLKAVLAEHLSEGQRIEIKPELEFYLLSPEGKPADAAKYLDVYPQDELPQHMDRLYSTLKEMNIPVERVHHENGPGQVEAELDFAPILSQADHLFAAKAAVRAIAHQAGLRASFLPKPFAGIAGSGMHIHLRMFEGERNLFGERPGQLSELAGRFAAGLLAHASALTAVCNPSVNSYKRLVPGQEAPVYICWGERNRSALLRVPLFTEVNRADLEFRSPDATANFYLALAALVSAGMDGVRKKLPVPELRNENVYALSPAELERLDISPLPGNLGEALDALERDEVVMGALGEQVAERFLELHRASWDEYLHQAVTDWEMETYDGI